MILSVVDTDTVLLLTLAHAQLSAGVVWGRPGVSIEFSRETTDRLDACFKELALAVVWAVKSETCRAGWQAATSGWSGYCLRESSVFPL